MVDYDNIIIKYVQLSKKIKQLEIAISGFNEKCWHKTDYYEYANHHDTIIISDTYTKTGYTTKFGDGYIVAYNPVLSVSETNIVLAHEFSHIMLSHPEKTKKTGFTYKGISDIEAEACALAFLLWLPSTLIEKHAFNLGRPISINDIRTLAEISGADTSSNQVKKYIVERFSFHVNVHLAKLGFIKILH